MRGLARRLAAQTFSQILFFGLCAPPAESVPQQQRRAISVVRTNTSSDGHDSFSSVAFGARQIEDDLQRLVVWRIDLLVDGRERAKEQVTRVGHDGGTARGDAILRLEEKKPGEKVVDRDGGLEFGEAGDKVGGEIGGVVALLLAASVFGAERGERICDRHAAATVASVVFTAVLRGCREGVGIVERIRVNNCGGHFVPRFSEN